MARTNNWAYVYIVSLASVATVAVSLPHIIIDSTKARKIFNTAHAITVAAAIGLIPVIAFKTNSNILNIIILTLIAAGIITGFFFFCNRFEKLSPAYLIHALCTVLLGIGLPYILTTASVNTDKIVFLLAFIPTTIPLLEISLGSPGSYQSNRPLQRILMMYITEALAFCTYFMIFRSNESFRLPQQTINAIIVSFILFLFAVSSFIKGRLEIRKSSLNLPILLITILSLFSFVLSPNFFISLKEFTQYIFVLLNFYLIIHCLDSKKHFSSLVAVFIAVMWLEAVIGVRQHFGVNQLINLGGNRDPFSTLGNKNYVAEMLAMTIPLALAFSVAAKSRVVKLLSWIAIYPMLFVVLVAITRGSWIGLIASSIAFFIYAIDGLPRDKMISALLHLAGLFILATLFMVSSTYNVMLIGGNKDHYENNLFIQDVSGHCGPGINLSTGNTVRKLCIIKTQKKYAFYHNNYHNDWVYWLQDDKKVFRRELRNQLGQSDRTQFVEFLKKRSLSNPDSEETKLLKSHVDSDLKYPDVTFLRVGYGPTEEDYAGRFMSIINVISNQLERSSKMWFVYFGFFLAAAVAMFFILRTKPAKIICISLIAVIMVAVAFVANPGNNKNSTQQEINTHIQAAPPVQIEDSIVSRSFIWGGTFQMIKHYPLGVGLGAYKIRYLDMLKAHLKSTNQKSIPGFFKDVNAKEAHCEYLHIWSELGPLGLVFVLFFAIVVIRLFYRNYYNYGEDSFTQCVTLGAFCGIVSIGTSALLGFPYHIVGTSMFCGVFVALLLFGEDRRKNIENLPAMLPEFARAEAPAQQAQKKQQKKNKSKQKQNEQKMNAPEANTDLTWKENWHVLSLRKTPGILLLALTALFFIAMTWWNYNMQMSNIRMKQANYMAQQSMQVLQQSQNFNKTGNTEQATLTARKADALNKEALRLYDEALTQDRYNGDIHMFRGMYFQKIKKPDEAVDEFLIAQKYFDLPQISLDLGAIYFERGEDFYDLAEKSYRESLAVYPNYPHPLYNLGLILYEKANKIQEDPNNWNKYFGGNKIPDAQTREKKFRELMTQAADLFTRAITIQPSLHQVSFKLALAYEKLGDLDNAIKWYRHTLKYNQRHQDAYYNYGLVLTRKAGETIGLADRAAAEGRTEDAEKLRSEAFGYNEEAKANFERSLKIDTNHVRALNNLGNMYFNDGLIADDQTKILKALGYYERALKTDPNYLNALLNVSLASIHLKRYDKALVYLDKLTRKKLSPVQEIKTIYMLGTCYYYTGKKQEAQALMVNTVQKHKNTSLSSTAEFISLVMRYSQVLDGNGHPAEAASLLEELLSKNKLPPYQEVEALHQLGIAYFNNKQYDRAKTAFERVVKEHSGSPFVQEAEKHLNSISRLR